MKRRVLFVASLASTATLLLGCASAGADVFGTTSLVSVSPLEQADYAHDPAISGNGRYVVFDGSIGGVTGVWRRELRPDEGVLSHEGNVEEVAGGDAELPSISENGQYVSFTTNEGRELPNITDGLPDPVHRIGEGPTVESPNVYVRDMDEAPSEPGAFEPVSAVSGSDETLTYEYAAEGEGENEKSQRDTETEDWGAEAAGRSAISDDGREVAFVTTAVSNLDGAGTPALEVAVRYLETKTTELVSVEYNPATGQPAIDEETGLPEPVPAETQSQETYGAAYSEKGAPPRFAPVKPYEVMPTIGASISGDGTTVAWLGQEVGEQTATLPAETLAPRYGEPLWRRIADGVLEPTRRVTGGSDPTNPACVASGEAALPSNDPLSDPCQGPFRTESEFGVWTGELITGGADALPRLSNDGYKVAFVASAPLVSQGSDFGNGSPGEHRGDDLYVADMHAGLTRQQALRQLTELASGNENIVGQTGAVVEFGISPDGRQVAFATKRIVFPLSSPAYVTAPLTVPGMLELYDVDLEDETLTRVTHSYEGGPSEHPHRSVTSVEEDPYGQGGDGAQSPSFSNIGNLLAFSSTASNLVFGDGNTPPLGDERLDGSDAFVIPRIVFEPVATPQIVSTAPPNPLPSGAWTLGVTASSLANGEVRLYLEVPGAGTVGAGASAAVKVVTSSRSHSKKAHGAHSKIVTRTVASAKRAVGMSTGGLTTVVLAPASKYTALTKRPDGLSAMVEVSFSAQGHATLHRRIEVRFVRRTTHHSKKKAKK
jgi:hypothetical protein